MVRLLPNINTRSAVTLAAISLALLCALVAPQPAHAYSCWYKLYDIDDNLIYAYDKDDGVTVCAESVDVNKLQQGVKYEFFYDGRDGDPLPSVSSMAFDVKIYDASAGETPNYGLKDAAAMNDDSVEVEIDGGYADPEGPLPDGEQGFFIGTVKTSGILRLKTIGPDTKVSFQIGCLPYVRGVGGSGKNIASAATYAVTATPGSGDEGEKDENGGSESGLPDVDDTTSALQDTTSNEDDPANRQETSRAEGQDGALGETSGASNIETSEENSTGKQTDSDQKRQESVAASVAESNNAKGNKEGVLNTQDPSPGNNLAEKTAPAQAARVDEASSASQDEDLRRNARTDGSRLSDMGTLYEVSESITEGQPALSAPDSQVELSGTPYLYMVLVALLVLAVPAGVLKKGAFRKRGLGEGSRLLDF